MRHYYLFVALCGICHVLCLLDTFRINKGDFVKIFKKSFLELVSPLRRLCIREWIFLRGKDVILHTFMLECIVCESIWARDVKDFYEDSDWLKQVLRNYRALEIKRIKDVITRTFAVKLGVFDMLRSSRFKVFESKSICIIYLKSSKLYDKSRKTLSQVNFIILLKYGI